MPSKEAIFDNIESYSATELAGYIKDGIVTFKELCDETEGYFPAKVRKELEKMLGDSEETIWQEALRNDDENSYMAYLHAYPRGCHADDARQAIRRLEQSSITVNRQDEWDIVDKNSISSLQHYITNNPNSPHLQEAITLKNQLELIMITGGITIDDIVNRILNIQSDKTIINPNLEIVNLLCNYLDDDNINFTHLDLLEIIKDDHNLLHSGVIKSLISKGRLSYGDLLNIDIDRRFIEMLATNIDNSDILRAKPLTKVNKKSTEVYFWGIPSSGKTCALGAILSVAGDGMVAKSMHKDNDCQGYGYMTRLSALFRGDNKVGSLPPGNPTCSTFEMGFDLEDNKNRRHPITFIDLAGELVRCMYKADAGEPMTDDEMEALDTLTNILIDNRTANRKVHFFVLEYGGEKRNYEGLSQQIYLDAALNYINRTHIFEKETDAIYLLLTKADKANLTGSELAAHLANYVNENYRGFYQGLESICRRFEINGGKVERMPFTLGEVCFQDYCLFNGKAATHIVERLLNRTWSERQGKIGKLFNSLRK